MSRYYNTEQFLEHHGVKGMKWGVRNDDKPTGSRSGKKTSSKNTDREHNKHLVTKAATALAATALVAGGVYAIYKSGAGRRITIPRKAIESAGLTLEGLGNGGKHDFTIPKNSPLYRVMDSQQAFAGLSGPQYVSGLVSDARSYYQNQEAILGRRGDGSYRLGLARDLRIAGRDTVNKLVPEFLTSEEGKAVKMMKRFAKAAEEELEWLDPSLEIYTPEANARLREASRHGAAQLVGAAARESYLDDIRSGRRTEKVNREVYDDTTNPALAVAQQIAGSKPVGNAFAAFLTRQGYDGVVDLNDQGMGLGDLPMIIFNTQSMVSSVVRDDLTEHTDSVGIFLEHHGVKGMKWGVRNDDKPTGSRSGKKDSSKNTKSLRMLKAGLIAVAGAGVVVGAAYLGSKTPIGRQLILDLKGRKDNGPLSKLDDAGLAKLYSDGLTISVNQTLYKQAPKTVRLDGNDYFSVLPRDRAYYSSGKVGLPGFVSRDSKTHAYAHSTSLKIAGTKAVDKAIEKLLAEEPDDLYRESLKRIFENLGTDISDSPEIAKLSAIATGSLVGAGSSVDQPGSIHNRLMGHIRDAGFDGVIDFNNGGVGTAKLPLIIFDSVGQLVEHSAVMDSCQSQTQPFLSMFDDAFKSKELEQMDRIDEYLEHFGVKGMKWGVRKQAKLDAKRTTTTYNEPAKTLSNSQLKARVNRLNMERQYESMRNPKTKSFMARMLSQKGDMLALAGIGLGLSAVGGAIKFTASNGGPSGALAAVAKMASTNPDAAKQLAAKATEKVSKAIKRGLGL